MTMVTKKSAIETRTIPAGQFKTHCLRLLDEVRDKRIRLIITKRGKPVAEVGPSASRTQPFLDSMRGTAEIVGDIVEPVDVEWELDEQNLVRNDPPVD